MGVVLITHNLGVVAQTCSHVAVMYAGNIVESGPVAAVIGNPVHPYTRALMSAIPTRETKRGELRGLAGSVPNLITPPPDDYAGSVATIGQLAVGGSVSGRLEVAADQDWFAVDLVAGRTYSFSLSGVDSGGGSLVDPWLRLLDANGSRLAFDDDGGTGTDSLLTFTATVSGRYYLSAEGASDTETGTYGLSAVVEEPPPSDPAGVRGGTPTDPLFAQQWHLGGTFGINVLPAWDDYTGAGVRIGVLDQGIEARHRDLDDNLLTTLLTVAASGAAGGTPLRTDDNHGTAVAGVIAAERNGFGGVGVAYNADLVSYYDPLNSSTTVFAATTAATYLRSIGAVDVLNNSWGFGNFFKSTPNRAFLDDFDSTPFNVSGLALARLAAEGRGGKGSVVVQSAGNTGEFGDDTNLHNFQNSRFVITVAATTSTGTLASFSTPGASVLVAAPGVGIVTSDRTGNAGYAAGDSTSLDGTSFSAPAVAGIVALMLEANADLGYRDVQEILALSARKISPSASSWIKNGATGWNGGGMHFSEGFGFGLVDARAAVRLAETWHGAQTRANEASLTASRTLSPSLAIPDNNSQGVTSTLDLAGNVTIDRVEIDLNVTHSWIGDLRITLTSPLGTAINLVDRPGQGRLSGLGSSQDNVNFTFGVTGLLGERAAGTWTLTLSDRDGGFVGSLESWSFRAYGNAGSADDNHFFTDEFSEAVASQASRATLSDTAGTDTLNAAAVTGAMTINLAPGAFSTIDGRSLTIDASSTIENAIGGDGGDVIRGNASANALNGMRGPDSLFGADGNDILKGGAGDDSLTGGPGNDTIDGGEGTDTAVFIGRRADYTVTWSASTSSFAVTSVAEGTDSLVSIETLTFLDGSFGASALQNPSVPSAPTLTSVSPLTGAIEDTAFTITYAALAAAADEADAQGDPIAFRGVQGQVLQ
jgi:subtilisin-like proprotein convertase family protein